jgi:hypothetical protein
MRRHLLQELGLAILVSAGLTGCSTVTPSFGDDGKFGQPEQAYDDQKLITHIQCALAAAVQEADKFEKRNHENISPDLQSTWFDGWGAKISLALAVNDKAGLTPSVTFNTPLENLISTFTKGGNVTTAQNSSVGLGTSLSSDATRTETIGFSYAFKDLINPANLDGAKCKKSEGMFLSSDLKINEFIMKGLDISYQPGVIIRKPGEAPYSTFTYEVKFIVTETGSVTPAWKLLRVSANQTGTLFSGSKIETDDLTITMGKVDTKDGKTQASPELDQQHLANLIGQAVSNALQGHPTQ